MKCHFSGSVVSQISNSDSIDKAAQSMVSGSLSFCCRKAEFSLTKRETILTSW